jgi:hypothetical protein
LTASLTIFDIDDTLFFTESKVKIYKDAEHKYSLSPSEFNSHKLSEGEAYDFSEFSSSEVFEETAKPIHSIIRIAKKLLNEILHDSKSKVIIVTARGDMDDRDLFLSTFRKYGIDIDRIHIYRVGGTSEPAHVGKQRIFRKYLSEGTYSTVSLFDDSQMNLQALWELRDEFPQTIIKTYLVYSTGDMSKVTYGPFLNKS